MADCWIVVACCTVFCMVTLTLFLSIQMQAFLQFLNSAIQLKLSNGEGKVGHKVQMVYAEAKTEEDYTKICTNPGIQLCA